MGETKSKSHENPRSKSCTRAYKLYFEIWVPWGDLCKNSRSLSSLRAWKLHFEIWETDGPTDRWLDGPTWGIPGGGPHENTRSLLSPKAEKYDSGKNLTTNQRSDKRRDLY